LLAPSPSVTKANSVPSVLPFHREKPAATKSRPVIPWFALRCPPSVGLNRLRNANTGSNLAESRHDCRLLPCLCEVFHPSCVPCSSSSFHLPYRLRSVRLERLDNAFVTLRRCEVNQTRRDFRCGNFGNVEISPKHPEPTALARLPTLTMPTALCLSRSRRALARGLPGRLRRCPAPPSTQEVDGRT
jgi:hypothetical protein